MLTVLKTTSPEKLMSLITVLVDVGVTVGVGVGVDDILLISASTVILKQKLVIVGVGVDVVVIVGVGVGVTKLIGSQLKYDWKSNTEQLLVGVGVGVGQVPDDKYPLNKSGQFDTQGDLPDKRQEPSKTFDKHHWVVPVL